MKSKNPQYAQDIGGIAGNLIRGETGLARRRLHRWHKYIWGTERYNITIEEMWADVVTEASGYLDKLQKDFDALIKKKTNGETLVYRLGRGYLPIDVVIDEQEDMVERCKNVANIEII